MKVTGEKEWDLSFLLAACIKVNSAGICNFTLGILLAIHKFGYTKESCVAYLASQLCRKSFCVLGQVVPFFVNGIPPQLHRE